MSKPTNSIDRKLEIERKRYDGKTHEEVRQEFLEKIANLKSVLQQAIKSSHLHDEIKATDFGVKFIGKITKGNAIPIADLATLTEIITKSRSGLNEGSTAYKNAEFCVLGDLDKFVQDVERIQVDINQAKQDMDTHNAKYS